MSHFYDIKAYQSKKAVPARRNCFKAKPLFFLTGNKSISDGLRLECQLLVMSRLRNTTLNKIISSTGMFAVNYADINNSPD